LPGERRGLSPPSADRRGEPGGSLYKNADRAGKKIDAPAWDAPKNFKRTNRQAAGRAMPTSPRASVIQFLRAVRPVVGPTDGELLGRFVVHRDGPAFAELVRRHGPLVYGTCKRITNNGSDADDAFQATFLVLVRKAPSIMPRAR
jgi:hypothetical protein